MLVGLQGLVRARGTCSWGFRGELEHVVHARGATGVS